MKRGFILAKKVLTPAEGEIKALKKKYRKEKTEKLVPVFLAIVIALTSFNAIVYYPNTIVLVVVVPSDKVKVQVSFV